MSLYEIEVDTLSGAKEKLHLYEGKVLLIVNTASRCGLTPQYEGLEKLYRTYKDRGFVVLGFPCNQFASQEPGSSSEIQQFCSLHYDVTFPLYSKVEVNGSNTHPLYVYLKKTQPGLLGIEAIKWNFTKFLIDRKGNVIDRYSPKTLPESIAKDIEKLL